MNESTLNIRIQVDDKGSIQIKKLGNELTDAGDKGKKAASSMDSAFSALRNTIGTIALAALGKQIIGVMDTYTQLESRLKLVTTGSENLASVQKSLYDISLRTHVSQANTIELYTRMARATESLGFSQASTLQVTETINQALIVSGATATESSAALIQLSQGIASGTLRGEEFNSVMEQTPRLARAMADGLGVNIGQLRGMAEQGQLTSEVVTRALLSQKETIDREYRQMSVTIGQAWTDLSTVVNTLIHDSDKAGSGVKTIAGSIEELAQTISANKEGITSLFTNIIELAGETSIAIVNIGQSIQGWAAVKDGRLSILEFAVMDAKEFDVWLKKDKIGVVDLDNELAALAVKRKDAMMMWNVTAEQQKARKDTIDGIDAEISGLQREKDQIEVNAKLLSGFYTDSWQKSAVAATESLAKTETGLTKLKDAWQVSGELQKNNAKAIADAEDKIQKDKERRLADQAKAEENRLAEIKAAHQAHAEEIAQLEAKLTDEINKATLSRYDYTIQKLADEIAEMRKKAGANKEVQDEINAYYKVKLDEARQFGNMYSTDEQKRLTEMKDTFVALEDIKTAKFAEDTTKQQALREQMGVYFENIGNNQLANELARLEKHYQAKIKEAGDDKALQAQVAEWQSREKEEIVRKDQERSLAAKLQERDLVANHLHELTLKNQEHFQALTLLEQAWAETSKTLQKGVGEALVAEFGNIGGAWGALWDSMLMKMGEVVTEMAVNWSVSAIGSMFEGWNIYHAGIWNLKDDEVPSILQQGEMVIPAGVADEIRGYMGNNGPDNWGGLLDATANYGASEWGGDVSGRLGSSMANKYSSVAVESVIGAALGQISVSDAIANVANPQTAVSIMGASLVDTAVSAYAPEPSAYSNIGAALGRGFSMVGLAGTGLPGMAGSSVASLGGLMGGWVGDILGDALNDRSFESIRDALESGLIDPAEARRFTQESMRMGFDDPGNLGGFFGAIGNAIDAIGGYLSDLVAQAMEAITATDISYNERGFSNYNMGDLYGESVDPQSYEVNDQSSSSSGSGTTGSVGSDGMGYNGESANESGWAKGGVVNRLLVPKGEDGWGALRLGEGVIAADTMKILSAAIRSGEFSGNTLGNDDVVSLLWTIASSVKKSADILTRFEYTGIPQSTREAVA